jgi:hypothetical protein
VRDPHIANKALHATLENSQPALLRGLVTRREQSLHAETNPEKRHARPDPIQQRAAHIHLIKRPHHLSKMSDARQHDLGRARERCRVPHQFIRRTDRIQRVRDRPQIPRSVVEN